MNRDLYEKLVNTYGSDPKRWPDTARAQALAYAAKHPSAVRGIDKQAVELDTLLDSVKTSANTEALMAKISAAVKQTAQDPQAANDRYESLPALSSQWKQIAATLLIMTSVGFAAAQSINSASPYRDAEQLLALNQDTETLAPHWSEILP